MMRRPLRLYFLYFEIPMAVVFWNQCCTRVGEVMWLSQPNTKGVKAIRDVIRKKRDYVGKIPKRRTPHHPPSLGNPCYQKKVGFIFHFRTSGTFLVFTKKSPFWVNPPSATRVFSIFHKKKTLLSVKIDQISPPPFL